MPANPTCCTPSDSAQTAAKIMRAEDTGVVPVIENEQRLKVVGVVTDRDLGMNIVAEARDATSVRVQDCTTSPAVGCPVDAPLSKAIEAMKDDQIRRIPVVDGEQRNQGIVSMADLVRRGRVDTVETYQTLKAISEPTAAPSKPRARSRAKAA
jgi:CBS domain-containing protein